MAARNPSPPARRAMRALSAAATMLAAGLLAAYWLYGHRVHLRASLGGARGGFTAVTEFSLRDSLPALEGGIANLEAFKATMSPAWRADRDRTLWMSDSLGTTTLEYLTQRERIDSVTLLVWASGGPLHARTVRGARAARWVIPHRRRAGNWSEVVAVYRSFPPFIAFRASDASAEPFVQAEGKIFHVVGAWYLNRREPATEPDTSYPLDARDARAGSLHLVARGTAIAVINSAKRPVRLRLTGLAGARDAILAADSGHVTVYRGILKGQSGYLMAYTDPGVVFPVFREPAPEPARFFVLAR